MESREQLFQIRFKVDDITVFPDGIMALNDRLIDKIMAVYWGYMSKEEINQWLEEQGAIHRNPDLVSSPIFKPLRLE
jgi:hypothetical protein